MQKTLCIITGSTLGGAEYVAEHIEDYLSKKDFNIHLFHGPNLADVLPYKNWLIISSTHGAGELPENLQPLFENIKQNPSLDFSDLRFAIIGLGSSDYDTFCFAVNTIEQILKEKNANEICDPLKIDTLTIDDPEQAAENWIPYYLPHL